MEITFDKTEKTLGLIKINVIRSDFQPTVDQKIKDYSKSAEIKGFRKGKVPKAMIKKMYGNALIIDEINKLVSDKLNNYLKESDTHFLGEPIPESSDNAFDWDTQESFDFNYEMGFAEPFDLKIDKEQNFDKYLIEVDDQTVQEAIANLKRQFAETENTEQVAEGDDLAGTAYIESLDLTKDFIIDTREVEKAALKKLVSLKIEDQVDLDLRKTFKHESLLRSQLELSDEDFSTLKGKFQFTLKSITHYKEVELNQEFYDKALGEDSVKNQEEFIEKIKKFVSENSATESEQYFNFQIREKLCENAKIELPESFLKKWLMRTNEELTPERIEEEYAAYAEELKWSLIRNKIGSDQNIRVEHEDVMNEAKKRVRKQFESMGMSEEMESKVDKFANNYLQSNNGELYMKIYNQVQNAKVLDYIKNNCTIKEKTVSPEEFRKL